MIIQPFINQPTICIPCDNLIEGFLEVEDILDEAIVQIFDNRSRHPIGQIEISLSRGVKELFGGLTVISEDEHRRLLSAERRLEEVRDAARS